MDKLPKFIIPLGLGDGKYPSNWLNEKSGINISNLNEYYAEFSGFYWIWKNELSRMRDDDLIGNCHNRVLWLNQFQTKKKKFTSDTLFNNLLKKDNKLLSQSDVIQVQPITFENKNLLKDFEEVHKCDALEKSLEFLPKELSKEFLENLKKKEIFPHNMFITKKVFFVDYCNIIFPWLEKCYEYCNKKNLCIGYNKRLPAFIAERFTSFWFSRFNNRSLLSYARLGKIHLSNSLNSILNTAKIPCTYYQFPTIHRF